MHIRPAQPADMAALCDVFFDAVQIGAAHHYTPAQRDVWLGTKPTPEGFAKRIDGLLTLVAETDAQMMGFMSLRVQDGHLDLAFVHPDFVRRGVCSTLCAVVENRARAAKSAKMTTNASHLLRPVLIAQEWHVQSANQIVRGDQAIENWIMEKQLS